MEPLASVGLSLGAGVNAGAPCLATRTVIPVWSGSFHSDLAYCPRKVTIRCLAISLIHSRRWECPG